MTEKSIFIENGIITRSTIEHIDHARHFVNFVQVMYSISGKPNCQIFQCQHVVLYSGLCKPCKETAKRITHVHIIYNLIVEYIYESWAVNSENQQTNVYSNDIRWRMAWKRKSSNHFDTILKPNTCAQYSVLYKVYTNPSTVPHPDHSWHGVILYSADLLSTDCYYHSSSWNTL